MAEGALSLDQVVAGKGLARSERLFSRTVPVLDFDLILLDLQKGRNLTQLLGDEPLHIMIWEVILSPKFTLHLMKSPLIASLNCNMFNQDKVLPATVADLYENIVLNLVRRAGRKEEIRLSTSDYESNSILNLSDDPRDTLTLLSVFAACAEEKNVVFYNFQVTTNCYYKETLEDSYWEFLTSNFLPSARKLGLWKYKTALDQGLSRQSSFFFIHKTFQGFFAAFHMRRCCRDDNLPAEPIPSTTTQAVEVRQAQEEQKQLSSCLDYMLSQRFSPLSQASTSRKIVLWFFAFGMDSPRLQDALTSESLHTECRQITQGRQLVSDLALLHLTARLFDKSKGKSYPRETSDQDFQSFC